MFSITFYIICITLNYLRELYLYFQRKLLQGKLVHLTTYNPFLTCFLQSLIKDNSTSILSSPF
nr:MAG TPA: hypothetical protein [Caudoviricetes sp.]